MMWSANLRNRLIMLLSVLCIPALTAADTVVTTADTDTSSIWNDDWDSAMRIAKREKKPVVVDFHSDGCGACKAMHKYTFADSTVKERLKAGWVAISINTSHGWKKGTWEGKALPYNKLAKHFRVKGVPTFLFIDSDGKAVQAVVGFKKKELFCDILDFLSGRVYETETTFAEFQESREELSATDEH